MLQCRGAFLLLPSANPVEAVEVFWLSESNPGGSNQIKRHDRSEHAHCVGSIKWITLYYCEECELLIMFGAALAEDADLLMTLSFTSFHCLGGPVP